MSVRTPVSISVSAETLALIDVLDDETILCGPDGEPDNVLVDETSVALYESSLEDFCIDADVVLHSDRTHAEITALADFHACRTDSFPALDAYIDEILAVQDPVAIIADPHDGMIVPAIGRNGMDWGLVALVEKQESVSGTKQESAFDTYVIAGFFAGSTISVKGDFQGYGIGEAFVIARFLSDGELPTWHHEEPCYSDSGEAVILKALDSLREISKSLQTGTEMPSIVRKFELSINMDDPASTPGPGS